VAKTCIAEAQRADRLGQRTYAALLRGSARRALAELDAITPAPIDPKTARKREISRAYAKTILAGFGRVH
jgi:hypothetical protein